MNKNILLAKQYHDLSIATAQTAVEQAVESGRYFVKAKSELPHGSFTKEVDALGLKIRTVQNYMKLANELPNAQSSACLGSIDTALEYLKAPAVVKKQIENSEESMTAKQIADLTKQVNKANKSSESLKEEAETLKERTESWRKQYLEERNAGRELAEKLEEVKQSKITYIKDDNQAINQELEELKSKLESLKKDKAQLIEFRKQDKQKFYETVDTNVNHRLESHQAEVERLTKQETSLKSRIDILKNNDAALEDKLLGKQQRLESVREALDAVATLAANSYEYIIEPELLESNDLLDHWQDVINKLNPLVENIELALTRHKNSTVKVIK